MFIKNYATADIVVKIKDNKITLPTDAVTYVDENLVTLAELKNMYGNNVEEITDPVITDLVPQTYLKYYQTKLTLGKLYKVQLGRYSVANLMKSLFVDSGSVDAYIYSGEDVPTNLTQMTAIAHLVGDTSIDIVPTYVSFKQKSGTTTQLIISGIEIIANLGDIS